MAQRFAWLEVPDDHEIVVGFVPRFTDVSGPRERDAGDVDIVLKQGPLLSSVVAAMNAPSVLTVASLRRGFQFVQRLAARSQTE